MRADDVFTKMTDKKTKWRERVAASQAAAAKLKSFEAEAGYNRMYKLYEDRLASDDPYVAWLAREVMLAYTKRDMPRLIRAKNEELLHVEWLPWNCTLPGLGCSYWSNGPMGFN